MPRRRGLHLHPRDLAILEDLTTRRAETLPHLHDRHFAGVSRKRARNRLGDLVAHGYLTKVTLPGIHTQLGDHTEPSDAVYLPGPKAHAALRLRSLLSDHTVSRRDSTLPPSSIPHQLATNRIGDQLGAHLLPDALLAEIVPRDRRHRPDAIYRAAEPDDHGRDLVFLEVDLGHYSRQRILAKIGGFLAADVARSIVLVTTTDERAALIARWIREHHGDAVMSRVQPLTLDDVRRGARLDAGTEPRPDESAVRASFSEVSRR